MWRKFLKVVAFVIFPTSIMVLFEIHQGFKGHFLNELHIFFNLYDKGTARCVHLFPQEEECTSSSQGDSKMYTTSSSANSQRMLNEINKSDAIAKIRVWVESDTVKH